MRHFTHILSAIGLACLTAACSITKNIPEDEVLYRGIKSLDYGKYVPADTVGSQGVIAAIAEAYNTVDGLLSGKAEAMQQQSEKEKKDSLSKVEKQDVEAYDKAREEVEGVLSYAPNAALMGSSYVTHPLPVRLWIYNKYVNSKHRFGKWMFRQFAATPVYVSTVNPKVRSTVAQNTLRNYGYLRGKVSHDTVAVKNPRAAKLSYHVVPGLLFHLDTIKYAHFPTQTDSIIRATMPASVLRSGRPFSVADLDEERQRIAEALRYRGYYYYRQDYLTYRADTIMVPGKVQLQVVPSSSTPPEAMRPYRIGNTRVSVYKYGDFRVTDSIEHGHLKYAWSGKAKKPPIKPPVVLRYLLTRHGDLYNQKLEDISTDLITSMGVFSSVRIECAPRDSSLSGDTLDLNITAMLDKPYDAEFQGNVTSKSNGQVGPGVTFSMYKHNAFRGAETLGLKVWGSYEWQTGANLHGKRSLLNSYEYGVSGSVTYPYIKALGLGKRFFRRAITSTSIELEAKWMNRANYFGRVSLGGSLKYTIQKRRNVKHEFIPISLSYDQLLHSTAYFDSIVNKNQALYVSMRDQFVPSMEYTYTWTATSGHQRSLKINAKEAGAITSSIYAICGEGYSTRGKKLFGVPFAQFVKASVQYTHQIPVTRRSCLATRIFGGVIYSYGNATSAPYNDRFSIGGANSVRAFASRSIGPGSYHPVSSDYSYIDQMGDIKIEANVEYRFPIVASLYGAAFVDAGNVWLIRDGSTQPGGKFSLSGLGKDIALGTGAGIRYDLDFLVLRFDVGVGIHAPYDTGKSGYYNMTSFGKSLGYHFAVGYPF